MMNLSIVSAGSPGVEVQINTQAKSRRDDITVAPDFNPGIGVWLFGFSLKEKADNSLNFSFFYEISYLVKILDMKTMGYPTKIQIIKRANSEQWYVNFPAAVAQAIEFQQGEIVEWLIDDHQNLVLKRSDEAVAPLKKKLKTKRKA